MDSLHNKVSYAFYVFNPMIFLPEKMLVETIADLFQAGSESTSTTLAWTILYLTQYPEVQTKLQAEIQAVSGNSRLCSISDRPSMPYAEAVISEVLRYSSLVPLGAPHRLSVDKQVKGYTLPKDSLITPNQYYIHFDPKIWGDPQNFRPERFLDASNQFKKPLHLIPFSIGRRYVA
jgi:cytochrome P450